MLEGKKTFIALGIALLGFFGLSSLLSEAEAAASVDSVLQLIGIAGAVWGRWVARPKG